MNLTSNALTRERLDTAEGILGVNLPAKPMYFELEIKEPPPILILAINPREMNLDFTKKVVQNRNRPSIRDKAAYILNYDFDELDVMSCSGTSAMFYGNYGLTAFQRTNALAYRNFRSLIEIYRNNGRNYHTRLNNNSLLTGGSGLIKSVGRVIIAFDDNIYRGSFDSFSVEDNEMKPFNLSFNFSFTISNTVDVRR